MIICAFSYRVNLPENVNLGDVVDMCPENLTGADFYALCSNALLNAIKRQILQDLGMHAIILERKCGEICIENVRLETGLIDDKEFIQASPRSETD